MVKNLCSVLFRGNDLNKKRYKTNSVDKHDTHFTKLGVSYAKQHTFSKVAVTNYFAKLFMFK